MTDPDFLALAIMVRTALYEAAKAKSPDNPAQELERMRAKMLHEARHMAFEPKDGASVSDVRAQVYEALMALMPISTDGFRIQ